MQMIKQKIISSISIIYEIKIREDRCKLYLTQPNPSLWPFLSSSNLLRVPLLYGFNPSLQLVQLDYTSNGPFTTLLQMNTYTWLSFSKSSSRGKDENY